MQSSMIGYDLLRMLGTLSLGLLRAISRGRAHDPIDLDEESDELVEEYDPSYDEEEDDEALWSPKSPEVDLPDQFHENVPGKSMTSRDQLTRERFRSDLRAAKRAGFKIGILGDLNAGGFICVSVRVVKLGISEEALQAWNLQRKHYLVLMIRFEQGYQTLEQISEEKTMGRKAKTEMRIALSERYKPSVTDAIKAFTHISNQQLVGELGASTTSQKPGSLETLFIGRPLNDLLRDRFAGIAKYRVSCGFSWTGAETFFNDIQGKPVTDMDLFSSKYAVADDLGTRALPSIVTADHISDDIKGRRLSFPLVAMQFVLRHFVRCTEFCLVCHCKIDASFEALKPYVCSRPLCLYQYMALGFGPSIEWEILTQPYVVDLLISFCYVASQQGRLREFPIGIDLKVPRLPEVESDSSSYFTPPAASQMSTKVNNQPATSAQISFKARLDCQKMELVFSGQEMRCPVKVGDWIVIKSTQLDDQIHIRVEETVLWPVVKLEVGIRVPASRQGAIPIYDGRVGAATTPTPASSPKPTPTSLVDADCYLYDQNFDELTNFQKQKCITALLDTLPDVFAMRDYLRSKQQGRDPSLRRWRGQISESALNLLRWIIASNRSCIMQVEKSCLSSSSSSSNATPPVSSKSQTDSGNAEDRVSGMDNWMQFRFAQGAPDKEQRFIDCVNQVSAITGNRYPTIFAWHGSPLANWHSIVRQGLNFNETLHGRAFGHGVYMSNNYATSFSYSQSLSAAHYRGGGQSGTGSTSWPNSKLKISNAMSLNEVVNAPESFTSRNPHYVVNEIDWIQTRYLFVKADHKSLGHNFSANAKPSSVYEQDPQAQASGENGLPVVIPITAVSKSRRPALSPVQRQVSTSKKAKSLKATNQQIAEREADDAASIVTDLEDRELLFSSDGDEPMPQQPKGAGLIGTVKSLFTKAPKTDFIPGTLDFSTLRMLGAPRDASTTTTKMLLQTLKSTLQVQESTPLDELGWYIHGDRIDNVYQWIAELHSFDPSLPLAVDMKSAGLTSIVLEMRFTNQFPFSPPFIRVIRPRFRPFLQGGGGHVTAGGALCMELLTNTGWLLGSSIESVLLQVRMAMSSTEPNPARLQLSSGYGSQAYGVGEAIDAYKRACAMHGWAVPKDLDSFRDE